ncbi:MAG TPA: hypothetical protein VE981_24395 [Planctomycetota bacterium]|nr:hypothetical protein [Planctomycetota bacterium]
MEWIYLHLLLPLLEVLYIPCDWLLGWVERFPPVVSISIVGVISGVAVIAVQKYGSNQKFMGKAKADLELLKTKMKAAKQAKDEDALARARGLSGKIGGKYMVAALKPSLWTVPLIGVVGLWTGSRLGFQPIHPGDEVAVVGHFEDNAKGFPYLFVRDEQIPLQGALIAPIEVPPDGGGLQARWKIRADGAGRTELVIHYAGTLTSVPFQVSPKGGHPPEPVTTVSGPTRTQDRLQAIEFKLTPSIKEAWWNLWLQWGGLYLLVAMAVAFPLRTLLKVH